MDSTGAVDDWIHRLIVRAYQDEYDVIRFGIELKEHMNRSANCEEELRRLGDSLLRAATATCVPNQRIYDLFEFLVASKVMRWAMFLVIIAEYKQFQYHPCITHLASEVEGYLPQISCSYTLESECMELAASVVNLFDWLLSALKCSLKLDNEVSVIALVSCLRAYADDSFIRALVCLGRLAGGGNTNFVIDAAVSLACSYQSIVSLQDLVESIRCLNVLPAKQINEEMHCVLKQPHPAILTAVSVFEGFRMTKKVDQMADFFFEITQILQFPFANMFEDMIRGSLLIMFDAKETLCEELAASQAFFYVKLPQIIKHLLTLGVPCDDLIKALTVICNSKTLLNQVDMKTKTNTFHYLLQQLASVGILSPEMVDNLREKRLVSMQMSNPELHNMFTKTTSQVHEPLILRANNARIAVDKMLRQPNTAVNNVLLKLAGGGGGLFTFDSVCASFCSDGNLTYFSSKLTVINAQHERPLEGVKDDGRQRALAFNLSFILLSRMRFIYSDMRPHELINASNLALAQSCFYKFATLFGWTAVDCCAATENLSHVSDVEKKKFHDKVEQLKNNHVFWDPQTVNYAELVDDVPYIGEILLEDFKTLRNESLNDNIKKVFHALRDEANFIIVCLVQWICSQPVTEARQRLTQSFIHALEYPLPMNSALQERMNLTSAVCRRTLDDLLMCNRLREPSFPWIVNWSKRKLPTVPYTLPAANSEESDAEILKQAFTYAIQQAWASPNVLQVVNRCSKAGVVENWCMVWLNCMLKLSTNDEMVAAGELCLAAGLISPVSCMLSFIRTIADYIFEQNVEFGCMEPKAHISAKFLVQCLQLAILAYWRQEKETQEGLTKQNEAEQKFINSGELDGKDGLNPVEQTIVVIFQKFLRETKAGLLKSTTTFVFHFMACLAATPSTEATKRISQLIPHELMVSLARVEPMTFNLDLYLPLVDLSARKNAVNALKFACMLRIFGGI